MGAGGLVLGMKLHRFEPIAVLTGEDGWPGFVATLQVSHR